MQKTVNRVVIPPQHYLATFLPIPALPVLQALSNNGFNFEQAKVDLSHKLSLEYGKYLNDKLCSLYDNSNRKLNDIDQKLHAILVKLFNVSNDFTSADCKQRKDAGLSALVNPLTISCLQTISNAIEVCINNCYDNLRPMYKYENRGVGARAHLNVVQSAGTQEFTPVVDASKKLIIFAEMPQNNIQQQPLVYTPRSNEYSDIISYVGGFSK